MAADDRRRTLFRESGLQVDEPGQRTREHQAHRGVQWSVPDQCTSDAQGIKGTGELRGIKGIKGTVTVTLPVSAGIRGRN